MKIHRYMLNWKKYVTPDLRYQDASYLQGEAGNRGASK